MQTALILSLVGDDGKSTFVGFFTNRLDLENSCHSGCIYTIAGIENGIPFTTTNFTIKDRKWNFIHYKRLKINCTILKQLITGENK
jgi:hypothetical protein